ncbi:phage tail protein, partial [Pseudomonas kurunegalensis]|uniref:phage tail protein n=1 Tax=Pseudomonas kurunegalensis TaxID=485880 RepID=UPI001CDB60A4|nr:phage tail protein [Pseudomonas kurunegalensis]
ATQLERALEAAADLGLDPDIIRGVADSARCPPNFLPWLAWARSSWVALCGNKLMPPPSSSA